MAERFKAFPFVVHAIRLSVKDSSILVSVRPVVPKRTQGKGTRKDL